MHEAECDRVAIARLRRGIDGVDRRLVRLLARRQRLVEALVRCKRGWPDAHDPVRVQSVLRNVRRHAFLAGLDAGIIEPLWRILLDRSLKHQRRLLDRDGRGGAASDRA